MHNFHLPKPIFLLLVFNLILKISLTQNIHLDVKAFLEGPFTGTEMVTDMNASGLLPLSQPYNEPPWNYEGTENVVAIPGSDIVDWVLVELRESSGDPSSAGPSSRVARQACFLRKDGHIVSMDGISTVFFNLYATQNIYVIISHRNHLSIMSGFPLSGSNGFFEYDFTNNPLKAYGDTQALKEITPGIWGMVSGEGNNDKIINETDNSVVWVPQAGNTGYLKGDYNLNKQVDNTDKNIFWYYNNSKSARIPDWGTCPGVPSIIYKGKIYSTVQIGSQCWMRENLNVGNFISGEMNPDDNGIIEKYCINNDSLNCEIYGGLYMWYEMMEYSTTEGTRGICPSGWHVPSDAEWCTTTQFLDSTVVCNDNNWTGTDVGSKMKEAGTAHWFSPNTGATNESGFTGLPGGYRNNSGNFSNSGASGYWWTSTLGAASNSKYRKLDFNYETILSLENPNSKGYSVRCVKDTSNHPPLFPSNPFPVPDTINISTTVILSWNCSDFNDDTLCYDVYFGPTDPPLLVSTAQSLTTYDPGLLEYNTTYYWRIVANDQFMNTTGGPVWSFSTDQLPLWQCNDQFVDDRDGHIYNTIQINDQCWMSENLNAGTMIPGGNTMTNNNQIEKYCYNDDADNCTVYGGLYQWEEVMQYTLTTGVQGICPEGWHVPTDLEWTVMLDYLGGISVAGGKMKETGFAHWEEPNTGATNTSGFTGLPGGAYYGSEWFVSLNSQASWWSSTRNHMDQKANFYNVYKVYLISNSAAAGKMDLMFDSDESFSVRCIHDETAPGFPSVQTSYILNISNSAAVGGGMVISEGNSPVIERGICWSTEQYPTKDNFYTSENIGTGHFSSQLTGLNSNTTYYVRAYATNNNCTGYGEMVSFYTQNSNGGGEPCPGVPTVTYEGEVYHTVQIGSQCWFRENLNAGIWVNGGSNQIDNGQIEKDCYYHEPGYCEIFGGLYTWDEMMEYSTQEGARGICPDGWHIPIYAEWTILTDYLGGAAVAGAKLKDAGYYRWNQPNSGATNESGFTALPGGHFDLFYFDEARYTGSWWTSTFGENAGLEISNTGTNVYHNGFGEGKGSSVRCIKDE